MPKVPSSSRENALLFVDRPWPLFSDCCRLPYSTSSKKERLEQYLDAGDIHLSEDEINAIDDAGSKFASWNRWQKVKMASKWAVPLMVTCAVNFALFKK